MKTFFVLTAVTLGSGLLTAGSHPTSEAVKTPHPNNKRFDATAGPVGSISIIIDKSDYELSVYDEKGWYATFPVVFGNNSLEDKKMEGDKNTPEGSFKIINKKVHDKWCRFLALDYPNAESLEKFRRRKERKYRPMQKLVVPLAYMAPGRMKISWWIVIRIGRWAAYR